MGDLSIGRMVRLLGVPHIRVVECVRDMPQIVLLLGCSRCQWNSSLTPYSCIGLRWSYRSEGSFYVLIDSYQLGYFKPLVKEVECVRESQDDVEVSIDSPVKFLAIKCCYRRV